MRAPPSQPYPVVSHRLREAVKAPQAPSPEAKGHVARVWLPAQGRRSGLDHRSQPCTLGRRKWHRLYRLHGLQGHRHRLHGHRLLTTKCGQRLRTRQGTAASSTTCSASCSRRRRRRLAARRVHSIQAAAFAPAPNCHHSSNRNGAASSTGLHCSLAHRPGLVCIAGRPLSSSLQPPSLIRAGSCCQGPWNHRGCDPQPCNPICKPRFLRRWLCC